MGCCSSVPHSPRVAPTKKTTNSHSRNQQVQEESIFSQVSHHCQEMYPFLKSIMGSVSHLPRPDETDFISCLTEHSFPLITCQTTYDEKDSTRLVMPIAGISFHEKGRVAVFGNIELLAECKPENAEYLAFLENLLNFLFGPRPPSATVYLLEINQSDTNLLNHNINGIGYHVESGNTADNLSNYGCVITIAGTQHESKLYEYILNGGGVIVCSSFDLQKFIPLLPSPYISPSSNLQSNPAPNNSLIKQKSTNNLSKQPNSNLMSNSSLSKQPNSNLSSTSSLAKQPNPNITSSILARQSNSNLNSNSSILISSSESLSVLQEQAFTNKLQKQQQALIDLAFKSNHKCNSWLSMCGLGITDCHSVFPLIPKAVIKTTSKPHDLDDTTFPYFAECYVKFLQHENFNLEDFSTIVYYLRYNILSLKRNKNPLVADIFEASLNYLQSTKYEQPEGLFYSDVQEIIAILLCDVFDNIDPGEFSSKTLNTDRFPGDFQPNQSDLEVITVNINLMSSEWHSTGLWLPAGVVATVTLLSATNSKTTIYNENHQSSSPSSSNPPESLDKTQEKTDANEGVLSPKLKQLSCEVENQNITFDDLYIQIGSQSESLLQSPGPWKRWPNYALTYPVSVDSFEISSPFGGLIYINDARPIQLANATQDNETDLDFKPTSRPRKMTLSISNVVQCPFYSTSDSWNETKNSQVPWSEILTKYSIITLPTESLRKISDIEANSRIIDNIIKEIISFSGYSFHRRFRLVFDVDSPRMGSTSSYPIMLSFDTLDSFINIDTPSNDLFAMIMKISIITIPGDVLHPIVEAAFGTLLAAHALLLNYSDKVNSPYDFIYGHMTPLFNELWSIYNSNDKKLFQTVLGKFQHFCHTDNEISNKDAVMFLVCEMEAFSERKFPTLMLKALNPDADGEAQYPEYVVEEEEEKNENN